MTNVLLKCCAACKKYYDPLKFPTAVVIDVTLSAQMSGRKAHMRMPYCCDDCLGVAVTKCVFALREEVFPRYKSEPLKPLKNVIEAACTCGNAIPAITSLTGKCLCCGLFTLLPHAHDFSANVREP